MPSPSSEYDQLRDLLLAPEVSGLQSLADDLERIRRQIHDPAELARLIEPLLADAAGRENAPLRTALIRALVPVLERAIQENSRVSATALAAALAPTSTQAIARHYEQDPEQASADLAPLVSSAIKETVRGERDVMIDALYPVIGSTIAKYVSETLANLVREMNERIESRLSLGAIARKLRARMTGVSEAELLLRESVPVRCDAAFLIHATSGLVMAQAQNPRSPSLDPDLLSGMLTAIRSLFNDSMNSPARPQELDQITYGESTIIIEVAGYCYLAAVVRGVPDDPMRARLRDTLAGIVQLKGFSPETFNGEQQTMPAEVIAGLRSLVDHNEPPRASHAPGSPVGVLWIGGVLLLAILIPLGIWLYRNDQDRQEQERLRAALASAYPGPSRAVNLSVERGTVHLDGSTENAYRRSSIASFLARFAPGSRIDDRTTLPPPPPFPEVTGAQAEAIASALNRIPGVCMDVSYEHGDLSLGGRVPDAITALRIVESFSDLPGLRSITNRMQPGITAVADRVFFPRASAELSAEAHATIASVAALMHRAPWIRVRITGYSDSVGDETAKEKISLQRAEAVGAALRTLGIAADRLLASGAGATPAGPEAQIADSLNRCVAFSLLPAGQGATP